MWVICNDDISHYAHFYHSKHVMFFFLFCSDWFHFFTEHFWCNYFLYMIYYILWMNNCHVVHVYTIIMIILNLFCLFWYSVVINYKFISLMIVLSKWKKCSGSFCLKNKKWRDARFSVCIFDYNWYIKCQWRIQTPIRGQTYSDSEFSDYKILFPNSCASVEVWNWAKVVEIISG